MSVPVSTTVEVFGKPAEYKSGEMNAMAGDGERKVAFITGTTGQDGSYLVELLLSKGKSFPPISIPRRPLFQREPPPRRAIARAGAGLTFVWKCLRHPATMVATSATRATRVARACPQN